MAATYGNLGEFVQRESPYASETELPEELGRNLEGIEFDGVAAKFGALVVEEAGPAGTLDQTELTPEQKEQALSWTFKGNTFQVTKAIKIRYTWTPPFPLSEEQQALYPSGKITTDLLIGYVGPNH